MGQALYRKYRSKSLDEIVGQEHITTTLKNAIKSGKISHAYLFTGPRGVGKTSVARILAHEINQVSYEDERSHIDIVEIDAASNRRIDEIRDLREKVHIAPASARYKVYIVDEVHMLTNEAFNALLKTLEEPPAHIVFILATTEPHKLPETIISRTQRFNFKPITNDQIIGHLTNISEKEKIKITNDAIELIARHGKGSLRDSISLLEQASNICDVIEVSDVETMLGLPPASIINSLQNAIENGDYSLIVNYLNDLKNQGYHSSKIGEHLNLTLRNKIIHNEDTSSISDINKLMRELVELPSSHDPDTLLEIILLTNIKPANIPENSTNNITSPPRSVITSSAKNTANEKVAPSKPNPPPLEGNDALWKQVLQDLKSKHSTLYGVARMARADINDNNISLLFDFAFHYNRIKEDKNQIIIAKIAASHFGADVHVDCKLSQKPKTKKNSENISDVSKPSLNAVTAVFKDVQVLD